MPTLMPPTQYDHPPTTPVIEHVLPWNELQKFCGADKLTVSHQTGRGLLGCSFLRDGKCYVATTGIPAVLRHELAHCNGWPNSHPGGWYDEPLR